MTGIEEKFIPLPPLNLSDLGRTKRLRKTIAKPESGKHGRKLNEDELREKFCYLYATRGDLTVKECAFQAGYSGVNTGSRLLKNEEILARIEQIKNSGVTVIERMPLRERQKRWYELFLQVYNDERIRLRKELGPKYRELLDFRMNKVRYTKRERKEGHMTEMIHHMAATKLATKTCNERFGEVRSIKMKWDKYQKRWKPRYIRGVIRL